MAQSWVGPEPIDLELLHRAVADSGCGAVVTFEGRVRNTDAGRVVVRLIYQAHPEAGPVLAKLSEQAQSRDGVQAIATAHRIGALEVGELAFAVVVSAPGRRAALEACDWLVENAKVQLPIWKQQVFDDGTSEWVNSP